MSFERDINSNDINPFEEQPTITPPRSKVSIKSVPLNQPDPLSALVGSNSNSSSKRNSHLNINKLEGVKLIDPRIKLMKPRDITPITSKSIKSENENEDNNEEKEIEEEENNNDDDDDDKPLLPKLNDLFNLPLKGQLPKFNISVSNPKKVNDAINPYINYKISTWTNSTFYKNNEFSVQRRFSDFLWLYDQLTLANPGVIIPPPPEKHAIGRFQDEFVEFRREGLEMMLIKISRHPLLYGDPDFKLFLECNTFNSEVADRKKESSKGFFKALGDVMVSATASFTKHIEIDEWFEVKKYQVEQLETQLKALYKTLEISNKQRKGSTHLDFGSSIITLTSLEINPILSQHLLKFGNLQKQLSDLNSKQLKYDVTAITKTTGFYLRTILSIKSVLKDRTKCLNQFQLDQDLLAKKNKELNKINKLREDKLKLVREDINQMERKLMVSKTEYENMTKLVRDELDRFDKLKIQDFQDSIQNYLNEMASIQDDIILLWQTFLNELLKSDGKKDEEEEEEDKKDSGDKSELEEEGNESNTIDINIGIQNEKPLSPPQDAFLPVWD